MTPNLPLPQPTLDHLWFQENIRTPASPSPLGNCTVGGGSTYCRKRHREEGFLFCFLEGFRDISWHLKVESVGSPHRN